jgi:hypothetical protein
MFKKLRLWLFPTTVEGFKFDAVDRDGDGIIQEGTPFERRLVNSVSKNKKPVKKIAKKKAPAKKSPAKKSVAKKPVKKKVVKKK